MCLEVRLLGQIELRLDGQVLPLPATRKAQSLVAYLVTRSDHPQPREQLADRFWPDRPRDKALHNLSTALWHIRRVLPPGDYILADAQMMQFNPHSDFWLDVKAFGQRVKQATGQQVKEVPRKAGKVLLEGEVGIVKTPLIIRPAGIGDSSG